MKVFIATPAYKGEVTASYAQSLLLAAQDCAKRDIELVPKIVKNGAFIEIARSKLVKMFLETDCTHLFFIDADIGFESQALAGLVQAESPFTAGVYPKREGDEYNAQLWEPHQMKGGWIACKRVGAGFICLQREIVESLSELAPVREFQGERMPMVFDTRYDDNVFVGEDYDFCDYYVKLTGEPIWVYPDINFDHDGKLGNLHKALS